MRNNVANHNHVGDHRSEAKKGHEKGNCRETSTPENLHGKRLVIVTFELAPEADY